MTDAQRVLITGGAGAIGTMLRTRLAKNDRILRLLDVAPVESPTENEEVIQASVTDMRAMEQACMDVDAVIHLAGRATEAPWPEILETNINGTFTVFEAARWQNVPRVVFASSNHAVGFFPRDAGPAPDYLFPSPDTYYGVSKATGEGLGAMYNNRYGLDVICLRILTCTNRPHGVRGLSTWLSPDDAGRLFEAALSTPKPGFRVVWGVSANTRGWFSLEEARAIGYEPVDDAERYAHKGDPAPVDLEFMGGSFCSPEFDSEKLE